MKDEFTDTDVREFVRKLAEGARADLIPKMRKSLFCLTILDGEPDIKLALEIGMALLFDKPLIIMAVGNVWISPRLRQISAVVIDGPAFDESMKLRLTAAIEKLKQERGIL